MEVTRHNVDELNAFLRVEIFPTDYNEQVRTELEKKRKNTQMPGFRKGMIPLSLIQKQYGKVILIEELDKLINRGLSEFIHSNGLDIIGQPIPKENSTIIGDFDHPEGFLCEYQIGLIPPINADEFTNNQYDYYRVQVSDDLIERQIQDLRRRYGKMFIPDQISVQEPDVVTGNLVELDNEGAIVESGIFERRFHIFTETIEDAHTKELFAGKKIGDVIVFDARTIPSVKETVVNKIQISDQEWGEVPRNFQFSVDDIFRIELATLEADFFDKIYEKSKITDEKEFREQIAQDLKTMFEHDSDRLLLQQFYKRVRSEADFSLPYDFIKRWIRLNAETNKERDEDIISDREYEAIIEATKKDLIQRAILNHHAIKIEQKELLDRAYQVVLQQYAQYNMHIPKTESLKQEVSQLLSDDNRRNGLVNEISESKIIDLLKQTAQLNEVDVPYDDFVALFERKKDV